MCCPDAAVEPMICHSSYRHTLCPSGTNYPLPILSDCTCVRVWRTRVVEGALAHGVKTSGSFGEQVPIFGRDATDATRVRGSGGLTEK